MAANNMIPYLFAMVTNEYINKEQIDEYCSLGTLDMMAGEDLYVITTGWSNYACRFRGTNQYMACHWGNLLHMVTQDINFEASVERDRDRCSFRNNYKLHV